ncbi:hypothetical protein D3C76_1567650 [compost metagenome]
MLKQLEKLHVPFSVVKARALAVNLMREATGTDDHNIQIFGVGLHSPAHSLAKAITALSGWQWVLQNIDRNRYHHAWPIRFVRP